MKHLTTDKLLSLGMALHADKRTMEHRVRSIFARRRSAWFASLAGIILCGVIGVLGFTTACQPAVETATETPQITDSQETEVVAESKDESTSLIRQLNIPRTASFDVKTANGSTLSFQNIPVQIPDTDTFYEIALKAKQFDEKAAELLANTLCEGDLGFIPAFSESTKAYYRKVIERLKEQIATGILDSKYETVADVEAAIKELEEEIPTLPDAFAFQDPEYVFDHGEIRVWSTPDHAILRELSVVKSNVAAKTHARYMFDTGEYNWLYSLEGDWIYGTYAYEYDAERVQSAFEANGQAAKKIMDKLQLNEAYACVGTRTVMDEQNVPVHEFIFTKRMDGAMVPYVSTIYLYGSDKEATIMESVRIWTRGDEVLMFVWKSPSEIGEALSEPLELVPFKQIIENAKTALEAWTTTDAIQDLEISRITLGYMRVPNPTTNIAEKLIPVWDFYGSCKIPDKDQDEYVEDEYIGICGFDSLLTINAVTGEPIRRDGKMTRALS